MTRTILEDKLAAIPDECLEEVSIYLDYIHYRIAVSEHKLEVKRQPGILGSPVWMSDDFDAPMEDLRELDN